MCTFDILRSCGASSFLKNVNAILFITTVQATSVYTRRALNSVPGRAYGLRPTNPIEATVWPGCYRVQGMPAASTITLKYTFQM